MTIKKVLRRALAGLVGGAMVGVSATMAVAVEPLSVTDSPGDGSVVLFDGETVTPILVATNAGAAVVRAAEDLADDFARVTGIKAEMAREGSAAEVRILVGTLGQSELIDRLVAEGKLDTNGVGGQWESYVLQIVTNPLPKVDRALVIAGSDRRGTIYGIYQLSQMMGVSPWYWWADVAVPPKKLIAVSGGLLKQGAPAVKYRGIFINDEDWGLYPWAAKTFDPQFGTIGPKTYARVFELMLRLRMNYLWPAMHMCSKSFGEVPENLRLADQYGIVIGASHCEPMLYNNIFWNERNQGRWNYAQNRDNIYKVWQAAAKSRGQYENVWTLGIRGIHDRGMETPPEDMAGKIQLMNEIFRDQRALLEQQVTRQWGPVAQCFIPYKEVLPIYDAGLKVPDDVTLVWVDDNFGYLRRLSNPAERQRAGGAGVYWHLSYYGFPHSYTWINTTAPALIWEELNKAWENDARRLWVLNVGDIKPMEIGIDYFAQLAWNPAGFSQGRQPAFLADFVTRNFGGQYAPALADLLARFYRLGTIRKPELMNREWALALTPQRAAELQRDYQDLLAREEALATTMPANLRDAYTELVGFPARVLGQAGLIFMADRQIQQKRQVAANEAAIAHLRASLEAEVQNYNQNVAGGKWNRMMPGLVTAKNLTAWNSQVRWPWGEKPPTQEPAAPTQPLPEQKWRDAATADRQTAFGTARWTVIEGLGQSGRAMALEPARAETAWAESETNAPALEFDFTSSGGEVAAGIRFLPTFRIYPGLKLRVAVGVDDGPATLLEVPGSSGEENENGTIRRSAVQNNSSEARLVLASLPAGRHTLKIRAVDPGAVIDAVALP